MCVGGGWIENGVGVTIFLLRYYVTISRFFAWRFMMMGVSFLITSFSIWSGLWGTICFSL